MRRLTGSLAALLALSSLVACRRAPRGEGAPGSSGTAASAAPQLKLEQENYDLGRVVQDELVQRSIGISNVGMQPLVIQRIGSSRFCSGSIDPAILAPGASGQLQVSCRSDLYGPLREALEIESNDPKSAKTTLVLSANVTPLLAFDAQSIDQQMLFGEQKSQDVHLVGTLVDQASIQLKEPAIADVEIIPDPPKTTKIRSFRIHCKGRKVGMNVGNIIISTGLGHPKEVAIPYACKVAGTLEVNPTNPYINLKISGPKGVNIDVRSSQPGFAVSGVHVTEGPYAATFEQTGTREFRVKVTVLDKRVDDETRGVSGKLMILSNDRTEPQKELPLFGFGQVNRVERPD